ncbi:dephospho-CoA kinase [Flavobacterium sp.]|uniref:dephospho-CoA kinase n=1 Tax=Flavobacterium sp. TaxID=239 RepID=UPI003D6B10F3
MTKIIGLTGGIGSGKTTIANLFKSEGIPVYIADDEAKKIMKSSEAIQKVVAVFGNEVIKDNYIDTKALSSIVFNNPEKLKMLNHIIHPLVKKHFDEWINEKEKFPYIIKEAAILFESGSYKFCNKIITVIASKETRIKRVMQRDNVTEQEVLDRIKNQWSDSEKIAKSDYIIENENLEETKIQFQRILKKLKNLH